MQESEFTSRLKAGANALGIELPQEQLGNLYVYFVELSRWAKKVNLIAKGTGPKEIVEKHFLDSLTLLLVLKDDHHHLLDVGTGAGFPGLVCKVALPRVQVTLVEPRLKRVSFLRHIVRVLGLTNIDIIAGRIEDTTLCPASLDPTDITSRAVTDLGQFIQMVDHFSPSSPRLLCMKGPKWQEELHQAEENYGIDLGEYTVQRLCLPESGVERVLVEISMKDIKKI